MTTSPVLSELADDGVLTITLADEANRNALGEELIDALLGAFQAADSDHRVRVVVVTNRGPVFCAGANLTQRVGQGAPDLSRLADLFGYVRGSPKPYVGRIAGHCVAGGMGIASSFDLSVAVTDAKFGFTEVRVGVAPSMIAVVCLPKMAARDARAAFLRGRRFSADEAVRMGLINAAVGPEALDAEVRVIVDDLLAGGPLALTASKRLLRDVPASSVDEAFRWTAELSAELFAGDEAQEGMRAFLEKRPTRWAPVDPLATHA